MSKYNLEGYFLVLVPRQVLTEHACTASDSGQRGAGELRFNTEMFLTERMRLDSFLSAPLPTLSAFQLGGKMKYNIRLLSNSAAFSKYVEDSLVSPNWFHPHHFERKWDILFKICCVSPFSYRVSKTSAYMNQGLASTCQNSKHIFYLLELQWKKYIWFWQFKLVSEVICILSESNIKADAFFIFSFIFFHLYTD